MKTGMEAFELYQKHMLLVRGLLPVYEDYKGRERERARESFLQGVANVEAMKENGALEKAVNARASYKAMTNVLLDLALHFADSRHKGCGVVLAVVYPLPKMLLVEPSQSPGVSMESTKYELDVAMLILPQSIESTQFEKAMDSGCRLYSLNTFYPLKAFINDASPLPASILNGHQFTNCCNFLSNLNDSSAFYQKSFIVFFVFW